MTWEDFLERESGEDYFKQAISFVEQERASGKQIFPPARDVFAALELTPFENVKAVIIGQDPYHGLGQAHGLCFSVRQGVKPPPSLKNIFKELQSDLEVATPDDGDLSSWARQGVLLLNTVLTVESGKANSHANIGWENFTDRAIEALNVYCKGLVFLLWGAPAQKKAAFLDQTKHHILEAPHPSPLSAYRGFFGCRHFSKTNEILCSQGKADINWALS